MGMAAPLATIASRPDCKLTFPDQNDLDDFRRAGVEVLALIKPVPMMTAAGHVAHDNRFEPSRDRAVWFVFDEPSVPDLIFWHRKTGRLATFDGRAFALGESIIDNPGTYSFGHCLNIFADPLEWLRARRDGIVILPNKWPLAFDRLRDCPKIAVAQSLVPHYRRWMKPARMPVLLVLPQGASSVA